MRKKHKKKDQVLTEQDLVIELLEEVGSGGDGLDPLFKLVKVRSEAADELTELNDRLDRLEKQIGYQIDKLLKETRGSGLTYCGSARTLPDLYSVGRDKGGFSIGDTYLLTSTNETVVYTGGSPGFVKLCDA